MQNIQPFIDQFKILDINTQKEKIIIMLTQIKESSPIFLNLLNYINKAELVSSEFLTMIYETIMQTAENIGKTNIQDFTAKMNNFKDKMQHIYDKEAKEHEDADLILLQIT